MSSKKGEGKQYSELDLATQEIAYTPEERAVRDAFVKEYVIDQSPIDAAVRIGFHRAFAGQYVKQFFEEPYVMRKIREYEALHSLDNEEFVKEQHSRIIANLIREANYFGPGCSHAARIQANIKLAEMTGMINESGEGGSTSGVMVVEEISDVDSWEAKAAEAQAKLKQEVKQ